MESAATFSNQRRFILYTWSPLLQITFRPEWAKQLDFSRQNMHNTQTAPNDKIEDIDSACLRALTDGDRAAFAQIVDRWQTRLINFFYRSTGNRADAEDLAQETFIELYRVAARYQAQGTFSAFIFTLARRRLIDGYRKKNPPSTRVCRSRRVFYAEPNRGYRSGPGNRRSL